MIARIQSTWQRLNAYLLAMTGKSVDYDRAYGAQCVDYVRDYADRGLGHKINTFSGSAINGWNTKSPFIGTKWRRIEYGKGKLANPADIVFFSKTRVNPYGHVAVVTNSTPDFIEVSEQNAGSGNGDGKGTNSATIRRYPYRGGSVGDVLGWYTIQN